MSDLTGRRAVPEIRQSEATECGLACLAMVLGYHDHDVDLGTLRRRHPTSLNGVTLQGLITLAACMDFTARALCLEPEQLGQLKLPAILHWDMDHFVVLTWAGRRGDLIVHDPASGARRIAASEAAKRFTGVALELSPTQGFKPEDERAELRLRDLLGSLRGYAGSIVQILVLSLLLQLYVLVSPFFMQLVVDDAVAKGDQSFLVALAMGFGLLTLLNAGATALRAVVLQYVQSAISVNWDIHLTGFEHRLGHWKVPMPAATTLSLLGSFRLGSRLMQTAWNGCDGLAASSARPVVIRQDGGLGTAGSCVLDAVAAHQ